MMGKLRLKCPNCGKRFQLDSEKLKPGSWVSCISCRQTYALSSYTVMDEPSLDAPASDETQVRVPDVPVRRSSASGVLTDRATGREYVLQGGVNLIGRMTYKSAPKATLPIETRDMGMSRSHLYIEVMEGCDGKTHAYAYNALNVNPTFINGKELRAEDKIALRSGDRISTSGTTLVYKTETIDDETVLDI